MGDMRRNYNRTYANNKASFRAFAQKFSKTLKDHSKDDSKMQEQGELIEELLTEYKKLDKKAYNLHVQAKLTNVEKKKVRKQAEIRIAKAIQYLQYKYGPKSSELLDFGLSPWKRGRPRKKE